jgi:hypothetical protein
MDECRLRQANEIQGVECDAERCVYWRLIDQLDLPAGYEDRSGCAIQHFALLENEDSAVAKWLLSVKERIEGSRPSEPPAEGGDAG